MFMLIKVKIDFPRTLREWIFKMNGELTNETHHRRKSKGEMHIEPYRTEIIKTSLTSFAVYSNHLQLERQRMHREILRYVKRFSLNAKIEWSLARCVV